MTSTSEPSFKRFSILLFFFLGVVLLAFVQTFSLLSPIYLSFLLTLLISLALNPLVNELRALTGGRKGAVIFMLMNPRPIFVAIFSLVPERQHPKAVIIMHRICRFAPAWGGSTLAGMLTIGVLVFLLMWPLLGLMDAMVLGLIVGLLESVPFLGPTISAVPAVPVSAFGVLGVLVAAPLVAIVIIFHEELYRKSFFLRLPMRTWTVLQEKCCTKGVLRATDGGQT